MKTTILIILFASITINARPNEAQTLTGSLNADSRIAFHSANKINSDVNPVIEDKMKSPFLAGLFSFILPGAGEFYSESYLKSAIFLVAEAAAITTAIIYDGKGDDQTGFFENYANQNWNVVQYAQWSINFARDNGIISNDDFTDVINNGDVNWSRLNQLESKIGSSDVGRYYSHRLAPFRDQQYYEMIGKYPQFNPGWDDFGEGYPDPITAPFNYGDPVTPHFTYYSGERGKANDFFKIAKTAVTLVVVNHILSAADAAWTASRYNKRLTMNVNMEKVNLGFRTEFYPQLNIQYKF